MSLFRRIHDDGSAVVEFALVVPFMLLILFGIIEFGRVYNAQITLSAAAREGVRVMAVTNDAADAVDTVIAAAPALNPPISAAQVVVTPTTCSSGNDVTVEITYPMTLLPIVGGFEIDVSGLGVMRCGG